MLFSRCFSTRRSPWRKEVQTTQVLGLSRALGATDSELELFCQRHKHSGKSNRPLLDLCPSAKENRGHRFESTPQLSEGSRTGNTSKMTSLPKRQDPGARYPLQPLLAEFAADHRDPERLEDGHAVRTRNNCAGKIPFTAQRADTDSCCCQVPAGQEDSGTSVSASEFLTKALLPSGFVLPPLGLLHLGFILRSDSGMLTRILMA